MPGTELSVYMHGIISSLKNHPNRLVLFLSSYRRRKRHREVKHPAQDYRMFFNQIQMHISMDPKSLFFIPLQNEGQKPIQRKCI